MTRSGLNNTESFLAGICDLKPEKKDLAFCSMAALASMDARLEPGVKACR